MTPGGGTEASAHFTNAPFGQFEADDKRVHRVLSSEDVLSSASTFVLLAASTRFVDQNPKLSAAMVKAMEVAMQRIKADPAKAAALYLKQEPSKSLTPEYVEAGPGCMAALEADRFLTIHANANAASLEHGLA